MFGNSSDKKRTIILTDHSTSLDKRTVEDCIKKEAFKGPVVQVKNYALSAFNKYVAPVLKDHPTLKVLDCSDFFIESQEALSKSVKFAGETFQSMCDILTGNFTLESLDLDYAYVSDSSAKILAAGLRVAVTRKLVNVSMRHSQFESINGIVEILEAINIDRFQLLDLYATSIGGAETILTLERFEELLRKWYISNEKPFDIYLLTHLVRVSEMELAELKLIIDPKEDLVVLDENEQKKTDVMSLEKQWSELQVEFAALPQKSRAKASHSGTFSPKHTEKKEQKNAATVVVKAAPALRMTRATDS